MRESYKRFASVYDALMRDVDYAAWTAYLVSLLQASQNAVRTVLDCACGTGEISVRLAQAGYQVTGVDASPDMLFIAQEKARNHGLCIPFVCQDMRSLALHRPVDAICCACDGVNYLTSTGDARAFFSAAYAALNVGGLLLFDVSSRYKLESVLGNNTFGETEQACVYLWRNHYDTVSHLCEMELTGFLPKGTLYERFDERHLQRAHSERELHAALQTAGFGEIAAYAAFTQQQPAPDTERIQFIAVRKE